MVPSSNVRTITPKRAFRSRCARCRVRPTTSPRSANAATFRGPGPPLLAPVSRTPVWDQSLRIVPGTDGSPDPAGRRASTGWRGVRGYGGSIPDRPRPGIAYRSVGVTDTSPPTDGRRSSVTLAHRILPPGSPSGVVPLRSSTDDLPSPPSVLCAQGRE